MAAGSLIRFGILGTSRKGGESGRAQNCAGDRERGKKERPAELKYTNGGFIGRGKSH